MSTKSKTQSPEPAAPPGAQAAEVQASAQVEAGGPGAGDGKLLRIAFNAKFLAEMLGVLDTDEVRMDFSTPSRAGILTPVEENNDREILMLVMPVMLNQYA